MNEYALLTNDTFTEIRRLASQPQDIPHKNIRWLEVVRRTGETEFKGVEDGKWVIQTVDESFLPPAVPHVITPRQCRLILSMQGILAQVEEMIAQQDEATRITWEYALEFRRNDPLLAQLAANLGLSEQEIDEFFIAAARL